ncbi:MAG: hypothetical protein MHM6MM_004942 [Cercozoa sp. M6MM]
MGLTVYDHADSGGLFWDLLRGLRNGAVYGTRVRLPHAAVMTLLFRRSDWRTMLKQITKATANHARNLALYVLVFKATLKLLRAMAKNTDTTNGLRRRGDPWQHLLAGAIGGALIFGQDNPVVRQINLYVFSRVMLGLVHTAVEQRVIPHTRHGNRIFGAAVWALVMYLFEFQQHNIMRSLAASMRYLYHNERRISQAPSLINWLLEM